MCDRKLGFFFLSCDSRDLLSDYDSVPYTTSEKIFCLGLRPFDFCYILTLCAFHYTWLTLLQGNSRKASALFLFYLLYVASLRFSN